MRDPIMQQLDRHLEREDAIDELQTIVERYADTIAEALKTPAGFAYGLNTYMFVDTLAESETIDDSLREMLQKGSFDGLSEQLEAIIYEYALKLSWDIITQLNPQKNNKNRLSVFSVKNNLTRFNGEDEAVEFAELADIAEEILAV